MCMAMEVILHHFGKIEDTNFQLNYFTVAVFTV